MYFLPRNDDQCSGVKELSITGYGENTDDFVSKLSFVWQIISILVVWWFFPIFRYIFDRCTMGTPKLFNTILWTCAQKFMPDSAAYFAIKSTDSHKEWLIIFFKGMLLHRGSEEKTMPWYMALFHLGLDLFTAVPIISVII